MRLSRAEDHAVDADETSPRLVAARVHVTILGGFIGVDALPLQFSLPTRLGLHRRIECGLFLDRWRGRGNALGACKLANGSITAGDKSRAGPNSNRRGKFHVVLIAHRRAHQPHAASHRIRVIVVIARLMVDLRAP